MLAPEVQYLIERNGVEIDADNLEVEGHHLAA